MSKNNDDNTSGSFLDPFGKATGAEQFFKHNQLEELQAIVRASINQKALASITGRLASAKPQQSARLQTNCLVTSIRWYILGKIKTGRIC